MFDFAFIKEINCILLRTINAHDDYFLTSVSFVAFILSLRLSSISTWQKTVSAAINATNNLNKHYGLYWVTEILTQSWLHLFPCAAVF